MALTKLTVALDWEPNANHAGFYIAMHRGYYAEAQIEISMIIPDDRYSMAPVGKVAAGAAHFAVTPSEALIAHAAYPLAAGEPRLKAVAALLQSDPSAIVTLKGRGLDRPRDLDGKLYASYGARFEGRIVQQLIRSDGGTGLFHEKQLPMRSTWDSLVAGHADATWIFTNVEGVVANLRDIELNVFHLSDYGIPYGYSPVLAASETFLEQHPETVRAFLAATAAGYAWAAAYPDEAVKLLVAPADPSVPGLLASQQRASAVVRASLAATAPHVLVDGRWGYMEADRWESFVDWLGSHGLLPPSQNPVTADGKGGFRSNISNEQLYTNEFLPNHVWAK
mmetsp:Transcript_19128/g.57749  ORF Transcript_19128/g.57749 Transcript_19128/m.57749 type:complete len:337 (-) Transcript_19128:852-1862(-)